MTRKIDEPRIPALDGIRGIAILLVMAHHFVQFLEPARPVDWVVLGPARGGWAGVDLFFVLSGFLITGILYDTRNARNYFGSFYARRILRIFPLYYAALALVFFVPPLIRIDLLEHTSSHWPWFWLYASNVLTAIEGWHSRYLQHFWSLAIEEQFYLVWPLLVYLLPRRWLIGLSVGVLMLAATMRGVLFHAGAGATANFTSTVTRADALAMGAIVALLVRDPSSRNYLRRFAPWVCRLAVPAAAITLLWSGQVAWQVWGPLGQVGGYTLVGLASAAAVAWSVTGSPATSLNRLFRSRALGFMGRYSYGIYVIHMPVDTALRALDLHAMHLGSHLGMLTPALVLYPVIAGAVTIGLALVSWHLVERPFLALKGNFRPVYANDAARSLARPRAPKPASSETA
jgi:peptidoglycan/LPS O-acetylase OafA/YrhL